jgi:multidrug efflux pump subunit AcrA (membrane-fusion protein)
MRQRLGFSLLLISAVLMLPVHGLAQAGASANSNTSANASANAGGNSVNAKAEAQAKADAQAKIDAQKKADAVARAAAEKKAAAEAKAQATANAAAQKKAEAEAKAQAQATATANAAAQKKAEAQAKAEGQANATAQTTVNLAKPSWQAVTDKLFGTPDGGLLDGKSAFNFSAKDVSLTSDQSAAFFGSSSSSSTNLAALVEAAEALRGQVRMDGTIEGKPFEMKLAGRELKIEGITLTAAQRDALSAELRGISGLHEAKIEALIDGRASVINIAGGRDRIELLGRNRADVERADGKQKVDIEHGATIDHKVEIERPGAAVDTHERVETGGRATIERPEAPRPVVIEKPERPGLGGVLGGK